MKSESADPEGIPLHRRDVNLYGPGERHILTEAMLQDLCSWEIIESKYAVDSKYYRLREDTVRLPDGSLEHEYYVREHRGWAVVFCLTEDGHVVLNRQYKHGIGQVVLELPAGAIDDNGESPEEAIVRELEEETGYQAGHLELIRKLIVDPTSSTAYLWVYLATGGRPTGRRRVDPREVIDVVLVTPKELLDKVRNDEVTVMGQIAALYLVFDRLGML